MLFENMEIHDELLAMVQGKYCLCCKYPDWAVGITAGLMPQPLVIENTNTETGTDFHAMILYDELVDAENGIREFGTTDVIIHELDKLSSFKVITWALKKNYVFMVNPKKQDDGTFGYDILEIHALRFGKERLQPESMN